MGRPSIFSKNYEEQMRRRRINITLIILIIIFAAFFYTKYQLNKRGININIADKFSFLKKQEKDIKQDVNINRENKKEEIKDTPKQENKVDETLKEYIYTSNSQRQFKVVYKDENGVKKFVEVKSEGFNVDFDILKDGTKVVFDDKENQNIIVYSIDGTYEDITLKTLKTSKYTFEKDKVLQRQKDYIWAEKPHFTSDGKVVFLTKLPYNLTKRGIFIWYANYNGTRLVRLGELSYDINNIKYDGFDENEGLRIISDGKIFVLEKGKYKLKEIK
ncbi:MAG: hypothetical protein JG776_763 [Caloramator sp.]|uniref:hypothetical protein n=1 Tax=Caloramator sp. TaxID=1871330 RepID=UPI001D7EE8D1|nr:hypothetical protein [Caloramator sp.]MBZ4663081.1 hypothetical protein [Caloramator sp.]